MKKTYLNERDLKSLKRIKTIQKQLHQIAALVAWDKNMDSRSDIELGDIICLANTMASGCRELTDKLNHHYSLNKKGNA